MLSAWRSVTSRFPGLSLFETTGRCIDLAGHLRARLTTALTTAAVVDPAAQLPASPPTSRRAGNGVEQVRAIAFYLPQYYPTPENNEWWGSGFTEWTNVAKARPLFEGHYQPHLPADLGFYDLRVPETRAAQAALAREHGIYCFCFYHYWFHGKRVLERPFGDVLTSGEPDFPFCLCWANENWSRAWDGCDEDVLQLQTYSEQDDIEHIRALLPTFADRRYIKVDGRPLFLVYRLSQLPDPGGTIRRWRSEVERAGFPGLYLANVESNFAAEHGLAGRLPLDAAVEFAPDIQCLGGRAQKWKRKPPTFRKTPLEPWSSNGFFNYNQLRDKMLAKPRAGYLRFPCVTPMWDNTPRRRRGVTVLVDSTPDDYAAWIRSAVANSTAPTPDENFIFINAWNEWGEGSHLEPCVRWGKAYLSATKSALGEVGPASTPKGSNPGNKCSTAHLVATALS